MIGLLPEGFTRLERPGTTVVVRSELVDPVRQAMDGGTLYDWAASHEERRILTGRFPVFAVPLPGGGPNVVVRRNAHGGMLASWRQDRFVRSRAPRELEMSLILGALGVPTPQVLAYAHYRVNVLERVADVMTAELPSGSDFAAALTSDAGEPVRQAHWRAVSTLLKTLAEQGVWHQDLNAKNIHLAQTSADGGQATEDDFVAFLLDVDRVRLVDPGRAVAGANSARLLRSLRKLEVARGARLSAQELSMLDIASSLS